MDTFTHIPVLADACIEGLNLRPGGVYVDATLGGAGHAARIAQRLTTGRLIGIDRDEYALGRARERLAPWADRVTLVHSDFRRIADVFSEVDNVLTGLHHKAALMAACAGVIVGGKLAPINGQHHGLRLPGSNLAGL